MRTSKLALLFVLLEEYQRKLARSPSVTNRLLIYIVDDVKKNGYSEQDLDKLTKMNILELATLAMNGND